MPYAKKEDKRAAFVRHYGRNRKRYIAKSAATRKRLLEWADSLKEGKPCAHCGNVYPPKAMDWHHVRGTKEFSISAGLRRYSKARILAEIAKCDLLCAVCHRLVSDD